MTMISFDLPPWLAALNADDRVMPDAGARMDFVIEASRRNIVETPGGPFAAAVFDMDSHGLVSLGANLVVSQNCSVLHAEIVAIMLAQKRCGTYDLGGDGRRMELVSSAEPCAMCFGAIPWTGLRRLVCGACGADARRIGFDEGPKVSDWSGALRQRGIEVVEAFHRADAAGVLEQYGRMGGTIYNPH
jgi:tRNA(Arg) A34 adenosine deaminase TadA